MLKKLEYLKLYYFTKFLFIKRLMIILNESEEQANILPIFLFSLSFKNI